ncbi:MAG: porin family protein [Bacteroidales bacterium]|nr:porin family protein [Bacteroidales bacterium]
MKKLLFVIGMAGLFLCEVIQARTLGWGVTGGMNVSKIKLDEDISGMAKPESDKGWYAGVMGMVSVPILGFGFDGALIYSREEVTLSKDCESKPVHFVSIPVHLRYDFRVPVMEEAFVPYAFIGPQFNYAMNDVKFVVDESNDVKDVLKRAESWRLDFGVGFILLDYVQFSYSYGIPIGPGCEVKSAGEVVNTYKMGSHRLGMSVFF